MGIFTRLAMRDGKKNYLRLIPDYANGTAYFTQPASIIVLEITDRAVANDDEGDLKNFLFSQAKFSNASDILPNPLFAAPSIFQIK